MKNIFLLFCVFIIQNHIAYSKQIDLTPLQINFVGIEAKGDTVIAYGDAGSMLISYDNGEIWRQIKVFENYQIIKIFWNDDKILAFNEKGQIALSFDKCKSWQQIEELNDSILAVIEFPSGYFIRTPQKLLILNVNHQILNESDLISPDLPNTFKFQYRKSIAYFKEKLIVAIDSSRFIRLTENLHIIDTLDFHNLFGTNTLSKYEINNTEYTFFAGIGNSIYKTTDFVTVEMVYEARYAGFFKFINDKIYNLVFSTDSFSGSYTGPLRLYEIINPDSLFHITGVYRVRERLYSFTPIDLIINHNKIIAVGDNKLIVSMKLNDTICKINSYFYGSSLPDRLNDSTFLFYPETIYGSFLGQIYKTTNQGITFQPAYKYELGASNLFNRLIYKHYDPVRKLLYLFARNNSYDNLNTKAVIIMDEHTNVINLIDSANFIPNTSNEVISNIQIIDEYFIFASNNTSIKTYNAIIFINKQLELVTYILDSNYVIRYLHCIDTNTFILNCFNTIDNTIEIKYTENKGTDWEILKKYNIGEELLHFKEINLNNKKSTAFVIYDYNDSTMKIDVLDLDSKEINTIHNYKVNTPYNPFYDGLLNAIESDGEKVYIVIEDTLFQTTDINDKSKW